MVLNRTCTLWKGKLLLFINEPNFTFQTFYIFVTEPTLNFQTFYILVTEPNLNFETPYLNYQTLILDFQTESELHLCPQVIDQNISPGGYLGMVWSATLNDSTKSAWVLLHSFSVSKKVI